MDKDVYWKIAGAAIAFLLSLSVWFAQTEFADIKAQNKAQWQASVKLSERMAHLEGFHEGERCYTKDKK